MTSKSVISNTERSSYLFWKLFGIIKMLTETDAKNNWSMEFMQMSHHKM